MAMWELQWAASAAAWLRLRGCSSPFSHQGKNVFSTFSIEFWQWPGGGWAKGCLSRVLGQCFQWLGQATLHCGSPRVNRQLSDPRGTILRGVGVGHTFSVGMPIAQEKVLNRLPASLLGLLAKIKV